MLAASKASIDSCSPKSPEVANGQWRARLFGSQPGFERRRAGWANGLPAPARYRAFDTRFEGIREFELRRRIAEQGVHQHLVAFEFRKIDPILAFAFNVSERDFDNGVSSRARAAVRFQQD